METEKPRLPPSAVRQVVASVDAAVAVAVARGIHFQEVERHRTEQLMRRIHQVQVACAAAL